MFTKVLKISFIIMLSLSLTSTSYCDDNNNQEKQVEKELLEGAVKYYTAYYSLDKDEEGETLYFLHFISGNKIYLTSTLFHTENENSKSYISTSDSILKISNVIPFENNKDTKGPHTYQLVVNFISQVDRAYTPGMTMFDEDEDKDTDTYIMTLFVSEDKDKITMQFPVDATPMEFSTKVESNIK